MTLWWFLFTWFTADSCKTRNYSIEGVGFFYKDDLLYRRWIPLRVEHGAMSRREKMNMAVEQLVLPKKCRREVMEMAHSIPLAGHLGKKKRVLQRFYWPTLHRDIAEFCRTCDSCQKTSSRGASRAPLVPLPIISQSFQRIAKDIVGPLPRSRQGNRFVLLIFDYATRYPEAVPMKNVDAGSVADELIKVFSRVGVPREILTDQGTNFTLKLLTELIYKMLHIQPNFILPPITRKPMDWWNDLIRPWSRCWRRLPLKKEWIGTRCYHMFSLHIEKFPNHLLDSHRSSY